MDLTLPGLSCSLTNEGITTSIQVIKTSDYTNWLDSQTETCKQWLSANGFKPNHRSFMLLPDTEQGIKVIITLDNEMDHWALGDLAYKLPEGDYCLVGLDKETILPFAISWGLGAYRFLRYKLPKREPARLLLQDEQTYKDTAHTVRAVNWVRDLINTPAEDMGPAQLASAALTLSNEFNVSCEMIVGDRLLSEGYPTIHAVGRASEHAPRLIDFSWGDVDHPKVTLVGKGVCFDTGGLDLKNASGMRLMKKDMGGAAHVLGLARMIMSVSLPIRLRVLIPAVENSVSGKAFRPGDVLNTRKGLTVEVDNTDAEGRLVLCDALTEASNETPDLIIDFATLTGAARVALGTDLPAFFTRNDGLAELLVKLGNKIQDPLWRLPLYEEYRRQLDSMLADLLNCGTSPFGGAITAALFLDAFVPASIDWLHIDLMAWNLHSRPGRPRGGEAMGLRAVFAYLKNRYGETGV